MSDVTILGLGAMGSALAGAFIGAGRKVTMWNRSPGKAGPLTAKGAVTAASVAEAVAASALVVVCLLDDRAVRDVLGLASAHLEGRTIVNLTNGTPRQARDMAQWAAERGARYVDGGIMAIPPMIGSRDAFILYSGSGKGFEAHRETLETLGTAQFIGDDAGLASLFDLALLSAMYGLFGGFLHAAALVGSEKVEAGAFVEMAVPWLNAMTAVLPDMARQIDEADYAADASSNIAMQAVALDNIVTASREQGVSADPVMPIRDLIAKRVASGFATDDITGLIELLRGARGT